MSSFGSSVRADALDHHHGLLQQQQFGPRPHREQLGDLEQLVEQPRHRDLVGGAAVDRLADRPERARELVDRLARRHVADLEMHLGGPPVVAGDEAVEDLGEEPPLLAAEPAHDAEIDGDDVAGGVDEQVPGMHVGVEEAVAERVPQKALDQQPAERRQIEAGGLERRVVAELDAVDPFERQHRPAPCAPSPPPGRGSPDRPRCSRPSPTAPPPRAGDPSRPRPSSRAGRRPRPAAAGASPAPVARRGARRRRSRRDRAGSARSTPGRSTLTATVAARLAVGDHRLVHLGDRGGRDRRPELGIDARRAAGRAPPRCAAPPRPAGTAPCGPAGGRDPAPPRCRRRRGASPGTGRA